MIVAHIIHVNNGMLTRRHQRSAEMNRAFIVMATIGFIDMAVQAATSSAVKPIRLILTAIFY